MANKTIDRKKAVPARSQAAKPGLKSASAKATRPSGTTQEKPVRASAEVLEVEDVETDEVVADEETETDEDVVDVGDEAEAAEEEEAVKGKSARSRFARPKKERELVVSDPQDYSVSRTSGSRLPTFPGSQFLYSSYRELRLVTWPSRHDTWTWSVVVVIVAGFVAILLGAADLGLSKFVEWWLSLAH